MVRRQTDWIAVGHAINSMTTTEPDLSHAEIHRRINIAINSTGSEPAGTPGDNNYGSDVPMGNTPELAQASAQVATTDSQTCSLQGSPGRYRSLPPIDVGESFVDSVALISAIDDDGMATGKFAVNEVADTLIVVEAAAAEARLGPHVINFLDESCENTLEDASDSGASSSNESQAIQLIQSDEAPNEEGGFQMTGFLKALCEKWPPENKTKKEIQVPEEVTLSKGQMAFAAAVQYANLSRGTYKVFIEAMKQFETLEEIRELPDYSDTIRRRFLRSLPLLTMRRTTLTLDKKKIESRKTDKEDLLMFDIESVISRFLSSKSNWDSMIHGLAHRTDGIVDHGRQARWWGESIRTTSGQCVRMADGAVLYPSDFIRYREEGDDRGDNSTLCWGRICWVGQDFTDAAAQAGTSGSKIIEIQAVHEKAKLHGDFFTSNPQVKSSHCPAGITELVVIEDEKILVNPLRVRSRHINVHIDYDFKFTKPDTSTKSTSTAPFRVRWFFNQANRSWRPAMHTTPLRGEREIEAFGRAYLEKHFTNPHMKSLPMFLFADGFGLFRNMYRAIEGLYLMPQYVPAAEREKLCSLIPLTLGPFGANKADIYKALNYLCELEKGKVVMVNGQEIFVCAFVSAFVGDMMEQQELSGCMSHRASNSCRYCRLGKDDRGAMDFDLTRDGRFDPYLRRKAKKLRAMTTITNQKKKMSKYGIKDDWCLMDALDELFPCLDRIRSRPVDAAHSEYQGLSRVLLTLVYKDILTQEAAIELDDQIRKIQFPPRWRRLQSGNSHLESYRMLELAHGCVILPLVLRGWLKDSHIKAPLRNILCEQALKHFSPEDLSPWKPADFTASDWLTHAAWEWSQSLLAVCGPYSAKNSWRLPRAVRRGRVALGFLLQTLSSAERQKSQRSKPGKSVFSRMLPNTFRQAPASDVTMDSQSQAPSEVASDVLRDVQNQYDKKMNYPNMHIGVHLSEVADEYGGCRMVFTLVGEAKHKVYKKEVLYTNYISAASTLLTRENIRLTIALLLRGAYAHDYSEIDKHFQQWRINCPALTRAMDPRLNELDDEEANADPSEFKVDEDHRAVRGLHRLKRRPADGDDFTGITKSWKLEASHPFFVKLKRAYHRDYAQAFMPALHQADLRWFRKVAFTTRNQKRFCFTVGHFLHISKGSSPDADFQYGRLDGVVIHEQRHERQIFLVVCPARERQSGTAHAEDKIIRGRPIYDLGSEQEIIGLGRIKAEDIWMVPVGQDLVVHVEFDIDAR
ncbi:hypothetical protein E4U25_005470 [Claviceps purpurea]|nr:hypothetical protein E4U28_003534 [Claviceps purpurea]KAG6241784.1 hypothetical protein E4U25_005470 [Claviceps purpurea]